MITVFLRGSWANLNYYQDHFILLVDLFLASNVKVTAF